ncbi:hypothetical protein QYM36_003349, partial [Artemia franciscana]
GQATRSNSLRRNAHRFDKDKEIKSVKRKNEAEEEEIKSYEELRASRMSLHHRYPFAVKRILLTKEQRENADRDNSSIGMKLIGGVPIPGSDGEIGAYVTDIYPGGLIDTHGEVQKGDQVLEINGIVLTGKSFEEVQSVMASTEGEVELVIRSKNTPWVTPHQPLGRTLQCDGRRKRLSAEYDTRGHVIHNIGRRDSDGFLRLGSEINHRRARSETREPSTKSRKSCLSSDSRLNPPKKDMSFSLGSTSLNGELRKRKWTLPLGKVQLLIVHDINAHILYVTIIRAVHLLTKRSNGDSRPDSFARCALLPGKRSDVTRQTKPVIRSSEPEWQETMVYPGLQAADLYARSLELTVWHHSSTGHHEFLGEFTIDLKDPGIVDEQPHWYQLQETTGLAATSKPLRSRPIDLELNGKTTAQIYQRHSIVSKQSLADRNNALGCSVSDCTIL